MIVPREESSSTSIDEDIQVDTNDESPESQFGANNDESSFVEAPKAATPEEELSPLHEAMIAEALKTQAALEAAVKEVFQPETTQDEVQPVLSGLQKILSELLFQPTRKQILIHHYPSRVYYVCMMHTINWVGNAKLEECEYLPSHLSKT